MSERPACTIRCVTGNSRDKTFLLEIDAISMAFCIVKPTNELPFCCTTCFFRDGGISECVHTERVKEDHPLNMVGDFPEEDEPIQRCFDAVVEADLKFLKPRDEYLAKLYEHILGYKLLTSDEEIIAEDKLTLMKQMDEKTQKQMFAYLIDRIVKRDSNNTNFRVPECVKSVKEQIALIYKTFNGKHQKMVKAIQESLSLDGGAEKKKEEEKLDPMNIID